MGIQAFAQMGNTVKFTAATTAPTPVQCVGKTLGGNQYRVVNISSTVAYLGYGTDAATATANAVIPTGAGANSVFCLVLLGGTDEILSFVPNAYFTAKTTSGTADIFICPGDGL
jgi:hypothetical protein